MKLQLKFTITTDDNAPKKVSKTFSSVTEGLSNDQYLQFAKTYYGLIDATGLEVYLIKVENIGGKVDAN